MSHDAAPIFTRRAFLKAAGVGAAVAASGQVGASVAAARPAAPALVHAPAKTLNLLCQTAPQTESLRRTGQIFQQQTGIAINITEVPFNSLQPKMMTELVAGSGKYDVFPITNAMMYPAAQYLDDLSALLTPALRADLSPGSIDSCRDLAGALRALPLQNSLPANFYRTDLLAQHGLRPPTTWEEYLAVCQATTQASRRIYGTLIEASAAAPQPAVKLLGWFYQNGGHFADANGKPTVNLDANVEALQFVVDLVHKCAACISSHVVARASPKSAIGAPRPRAPAGPAHDSGPESAHRCAGSIAAPASFRTILLAT